MTVSLDALTPSADLHTLTGSTPPGAARPVQPFGVATSPAANVDDTFVPLGGAALDVLGRLEPARSDVKVIRLAERVAALAPVSLRAAARRAKRADAVDAKLPDLPPTPQPESWTKIENRSVEGWYIATFSYPTTPDEAHAAAMEAWNAEVAEGKRIEADLRARHRISQWEALERRTYRRLIRRAWRLTYMQPRTQDGLKAKAAAAVAVMRTGASDVWANELHASVSRDALRIISAEADARAEADRLLDGGLLALGRKWQDCAARHDRAVERKLAIEESVVVPAMPEALFFDSERDPSVLGAYTSTHVRTGRRCYGASSILSLRRPWHHDFCRARRDEILAAYDGWEAAREAAEAVAGLPAAEQEAHIIATEHLALRQSILPIPAQTVEGALLKLRVARWCTGEIESMEIDLETFVRTGEAENDAFLLAFALDAARLLDRGRAVLVSPILSASAA